VQLASLVGFLVGLVLGVVLMDLIVPHVSGQIAKTVVALVVLLVPAALVGGLGRQVGMHAWRSIAKVRLGALDAAAGAVIAVAGLLVLCWLFASVLVNSRFTVVSNAVDQSTIVRALDKVMPPIPNEFQAVEKYLGDHGFPLAFADLYPETSPVTLPTAAQVQEAVDNAGNSTVKVVGIACGQEQEGSGIVVGAHFVVTNAHVVAGEPQITVETPYDGSHPAFAAYFDPKFDIAVLYIEGAALPERPLQLDPDLVGRGTEVAVLGYPENGPFNAQPAGVLEPRVATGLDIYDNAYTTRTIYEIESLVRPGNSGGPLVEPGGEVIGVVFSREAGDADLGFALASPGVLSRVAIAERDPRPVSTENCVG
jgi:S1-C subfamily serine protease